MSAKCLDRKGRWRKVTVAFRASPEENEQIAAFAKLCGMTKQDYMLSRLLQKEVIVQGNPRVYKALKAELREVNAAFNARYVSGEQGAARRSCFGRGW